MLDSADRARTLRLNRDEVRKRHRQTAPIEAALRESSRLGFGLYRGAALSGIQAIGAASVDAAGRAFGSVSVAIADNDPSLTRIRRIAENLRAEAALVSAEMQRLRLDV